MAIKIIDRTKLSEQVLLKVRKTLDLNIYTRHKNTWYFIFTIKHYNNDFLLNFLPLKSKICILNCDLKLWFKVYCAGKVFWFEDAISRCVWYCVCVFVKCWADGLWSMSLYNAMSLTKTQTNSKIALTKDWTLEAFLRLFKY